MEVLKSQAIAARTFALYQNIQNKTQAYDVRSDIYSQVYGGRASERWATTKAVNLTKDKVLTFGDKIFPAYYHATCAGYTEDASNLWNIDLPALKGVECKFCTPSPHYRWTKDIPLWEVRRKLEEGGYKIGDMESVNILSKNKSGRIDKLEIKDKSGISIILTGKDFRQIFGPNVIRSTKFDASIKWHQLVLKGSGWGHGVGMCQWGAYGMAKKGKKAEEILQHYYPGAEITTIDKVVDKQ
jgi:stage II sporulation protein D